jgi:hypothetical protein
MAKEKYSKEEMKSIIDKAEKLKQKQDETYTQEDIEKIAKNMNIPIEMVRDAIKLYDRNTSGAIKKAGNPKTRNLKRYLIYSFYTIFWAIFITVLVIVPSTYENRWSSWVWMIPSIAFVGLIMGAFINELEGAIIGMFAGALSGLLIIYLVDWLWGQIVIGTILGFTAFIVFLFRFKGQIDAVIK